MSENPFLSKNATPKSNLESINHYRSNILPESLSSLAVTNKHIDEVFTHCTSAYSSAKTQSERDETERQTMRYAADILSKLTADIHCLAEDLEKYIHLQMEVVEKELPAKMGNSGTA